MESTANEDAEDLAIAAVCSLVDATLRAAQLLVPLLEDDVHVRDGMRTFPAWLAYRFRLRRHDALAWAGRVEALRDAAEEGVDVAALIADETSGVGLGDLDVIHRRGASYEHGFAKAAEAASPEDLDKVLRLEQIAREQAEAAKAGDGTEPDTTVLDVKRGIALRGRTLKMHFRDDGTATLTATGPTLEMETIRLAWSVQRSRRSTPCPPVRRRRRFRLACSMRCTRWPRAASQPTRRPSWQPSSCTPPRR